MSSLSSKWLVAVLALGCICVVLLIAWRRPGAQPPEASRDNPADVHGETEVAAPEVPVLPPGRAMIGGVERPASDVQLQAAAPEADTSREPPKRRQGFSPAVAPETNPQTQAVAEALKSRERPERFSSFVVARNFDQAAFEADPVSYATEFASVVEPGRVFAPAQPSDDTPVLRSASKRFHRVKQGESDPQGALRGTDALIESHVRYRTTGPGCLCIAADACFPRRDRTADKEPSPVEHASSQQY